MHILGIDHCPVLKPKDSPSRPCIYIGVPTRRLLRSRRDSSRRGARREAYASCIYIYSQIPPILFSKSSSILTYAAYYSNTMFSSLVLLGCVIEFFIPVQALPLKDDYTLESRDLANCVSPHSQIDTTCWGILGMTTFLLNWQTDTPTCAVGGNTTACCNAGEAWSSCFLRMYQPESGTDCTQVDSCKFSPSLASLPSGNVTARAHYLIYNIYGKRLPSNKMIAYMLIRNQP